MECRAHVRTDGRVVSQCVCVFMYDSNYVVYVRD